MAMKVPRRKRDFPYSIKLRNGTRLEVVLPAKWIAIDRSGQPAFLPPAMRYLDRLEVLYTPARGTAGYIAALREALGMSRTQFARAIGVQASAVQQWETRRKAPSSQHIRAIERLRRQARRQGATVAA